MNNPRGKILNIARGARKRKKKKERTKRNHHKEKKHNPRVLITHVQYDLRSLSRWGLRESKSDRKVRDWLGRNLRTLDSEGGPKIGTETCSGENLLVVIGVYTHTHTQLYSQPRRSCVCWIARTCVRANGERTCHVTFLHGTFHLLSTPHPNDSRLSVQFWPLAFTTALTLRRWIPSNTAAFGPRVLCLIRPRERGDLRPRRESTVSTTVGS